MALFQFIYYQTEQNQRRKCFFFCFSFCCSTANNKMKFIVLFTVSEQLIDEASFSGVILPSSEWNTLNYIGKNARITYR